MQLSKVPHYKLIPKVCTLLQASPMSTKCSLPSHSLCRSMPPIRFVVHSTGGWGRGRGRESVGGEHPDCIFSITSIRESNTAQTTDPVLSIVISGLTAKGDTRKARNPILKCILPKKVANNSVLSQKYSTINA